jgi:hypothetical protein
MSEQSKKFKSNIGSNQPTPSATPDAVADNKSSPNSGMSTKTNQENMVKGSTATPEEIQANQNQSQQSQQVQDNSNIVTDLTSQQLTPEQEQNLTESQQLNAPQPTSNAAPEGINASDFIKDISAENDAWIAEQKERKRKKDLITNAINSLNVVKVDQNKNILTVELIAEKRYYGKITVTDEEGNKVQKSIYDFLEDDEVTSVIQFIIPEADKDNVFGDPITEPISFYWSNPKFL